MTTRNLVPRADGEGSLGTAAKQWGAMRAKNIYIDGVDITEQVTETADKADEAAASATAAAGSVVQAEAIKDAMIAAYGYPLTAATASAMTDTTKIYVYTGSETGYTFGDWYYHNGTAWTDGGVYNAIAFNTDPTLSISGAAADSQVAGDVVRYISSLDNINILMDERKTHTGTGASGQFYNALPAVRYNNLYVAITSASGTDGTQTAAGFIQVKYTDNTYLTTTITNLNTPYKVADNTSKTIESYTIAGYRSATAPGVSTTSSWTFIVYTDDRPETFYENASMSLYEYNGSLLKSLALQKGSISGSTGVISYGGNAGYITDDYYELPSHVLHVKENNQTVFSYTFMYLYDSNKSFIKYINFSSQLNANPSGIIFLPSNAKYALFGMTKIDTTKTDFSPSDLEYLISFVDSVDCQNVRHDMWKSLPFHNGGYNLSTDTINTSSNAYIIAKFLVEKNTYYSYNFLDKEYDGKYIIIDMYGCDTAGNVTGYARINATDINESTFYSGNNIAIVLLMRFTASPNITTDVLSNVDVELFKTPCLDKLTIYSHNIGRFNFGTSTSSDYGIPAPYASNLNLWKANLQETNPDIFCIQEYTQYLKQEDHTVKVGALFDNYFPFSDNGTGDLHTRFNKYLYTISTLTIGSDSRTVNMVKVPLKTGGYVCVVNVHLNYLDAATRASELSDLFTQLASEKNVIVIGDMNAEPSEIATAISGSGYKMINGDIAAETATYNNTGVYNRAIDNCLYKGDKLLFAGFARVNYVTSDHYGIVVDFKYR